MSGSSSAAAVTARRGSSFSDKQICAAVRDGRAVEIRTSTTGRLIMGWVYGMDDFHWGIVGADGTTQLVHKSAPQLVFTPHLLSKQSKDVRAVVEPIVEPFYDRVMRDVYRTTLQTAAI